MIPSLASAGGTEAPRRWRLPGGGKAMWLGLFVILTVALAATLAAHLSPFPPNRLSIANRLRPPSMANWFGTDEFGRDVFTRTLYAGRISLGVAVSALALASLVGVPLGLLAGYFRRVDMPLTRLLDAMSAFPEILLAIALVAAFGPSVPTVVVVLGTVAAPRFARIVRASTLVLRELTYVEASRSLGSSHAWILSRHVLPNLVSPIAVQGSFVFAHALLAEASLSFLGLGVSPEVPTWGTMISAGRQYVGKADWLTLFPGVAIVLCVLSLQLIGDGLRDHLDPRVRKDT